MVLRVRVCGFLWNWGVGCYYGPLQYFEEIMGPCWMMQWVHILHTAVPTWQRLLVLAVTLCPLMTFRYVDGYKTTQKSLLVFPGRTASTHSIPSQQIVMTRNLAEVARWVSCLLRWQHASCHLPGFFYCSPCTPSRFLFSEFNFPFRIRSTWIVRVFLK
jgi:hypothetical protein